MIFENGPITIFYRKIDFKHIFLILLTCAKKAWVKSWTDLDNKVFGWFPSCQEAKVESKNQEKEHGYK